MYKEGYYLHNTAIPYYAYDYNREASKVFLFLSNVDYRDSNPRVPGIALAAISDQVGASVHDRVHFYPLVLLANSTATWINLRPVDLINISLPDSGDSEDEEEAEPEYPPIFQDPVGSPVPSGFCTIAYYLVVLVSVSYHPRS